MARSIKIPVGKLKIPRLPQVTDEPDVFEEMTLQEHLEELRDRIMKMVIAIVPAFLFGFFIAGRILHDITQKANAVDGMDVKSPTDTLTLTFKIALYVAIAICMPIIVYQVVAFLAPGLTRKEKRLLFSALPFVTILFAIGVYYGYFIAAPRALYFLSNWNTDAFNWQPDGNETVSFFMTLMIGLGLAFQLPVIMFIVAKIGVITPKMMRKWRKYAFMLLLVAAAIITPSTDPYNMAVVAIPLIILYEFGIIISSIFAKTTMRGGSANNEKAVESAADV
ncbi:MAG TPA: twin-arginine translocase subunit TatC [Thermomicrobiales bacterium]|jgi:sec-independent protein translocase protein TatC|nr:twin-arginine translocase subunit TatC [Thermomicrobiales bacterium]